MSAKQAPPEATRVKVGSVSLPLYPWKEPRSGRTYWRWSWKDTAGRWNYGTRAKREDAVEAARAQARTIHNGALDLAAITAAQADLARQFLALDPTSEDLRKLREWKARAATSASTLVTRWHAAKLAALHGVESPHLRNVRQWLEKFAAAHPGPAADLTHAQLAAYIEAAHTNPKSRRDGRARLVSLWKFARTHELIDNHEADKIPDYRAATPAAVTLWTPGEMRTLIEACPDEFLPWLVLASFSGLRSEEIAPKPGTKPPLEWRHIHATHIDLAAAGSKVRKRRLVPVTPTLAAWLEKLRPKGGGVVCPRLPAEHVTRPLGQLVGGWRKNALRHSYGSYRAAKTKDLPALAIEMGTSHSMIEKHYREAVPADVASRFWNLTPSEVSRKPISIR